MTRALKVCLVRPPAVTNVGIAGQNAVPPIGLAYIAGSLVAAGHDVSVVDAVGEAPDEYRPIAGVRNSVSHGLDAQTIASRVPADVELIGVSCMFSVEWLYDVEVLEALRARFPEVPIIVGGEHVNACCEYILESCAAVDVCVLGEGEETIVELARAVAEGTSVSGVAGCAYRGVDGVPVRSAPRKRIQAIDDIPPPAWSLFPLKTYMDGGLTWGVNMGRTMPILASRGCPYQCTFCSSPFMWTTKWTAREPSLVVGEMKRYVEEYGATAFSFYDLTAIVRRDWIVAFCEELLREGLDVEWQLPSGTRSEAIDSDVAALMHKAGLRHLNYAPESGSPEVLKRIKKKIVPERMLESMRGACSAGLKVKANIIFGFPDETPKEVLETYRFIVQMALAGAEDMGPYPYSPYPGCEQFEALRSKGRITLNDDYFHELLAFTDPANRISFAERFTARQLNAIVWGSAFLFYGVKYARKPWALPSTLVNVLRRQTEESRLQKQLIHAKRKHDALLDHGPTLPGPVREAVAWYGVVSGKVPAFLRKPKTDREARRSQPVEAPQGPRASLLRAEPVVTRPVPLGVSAARG